jgi:DNA-binding transcriptional MerR regulator
MVRNQAKSSDTIGGLAKAAGVGVETVRYYQRRGLLPEPARPAGEIRRYGGEDLRRLRFIRSAQTAGFTLNEIKELLISPMTPVVKLAFDGLCDDGAIAQLEAVLAWALAEDLPRGSLAERIEAAGGIAPLLSGEAAAN